MHQDAPQEVEEGLARVALLQLVCVRDAALVGVGVYDVPQLCVLEVALAYRQLPLSTEAEVRSSRPVQCLHLRSSIHLQTRRRAR